MKKILILFAAASFIMSCGNNNDTNNNTAGTSTDTAASTNTDAGNATPAGGAASADADKGLNLIAGSDCLTCHKVEEKLVGPAYRDVAKKYPDTPEMIDSLSNKIIHGGAGNWGPVAMTPHPALSKADAETMVKYILSLKQ
jgi:cytochrome c